MSRNKSLEEQTSPSESPPGSGGRQSLDKKRATRRRILGATLGTPLIYTLPVGAQEARTSQKCELNEDNFLTQGTKPDGYKYWTGEGENTQWVTESCWNSWDRLGSFRSINDIA